MADANRHQEETSELNELIESQMRAVEKLKAEGQGLLEEKEQYRTGFDELVA